MDARAEGRGSGGVGEEFVYRRVSELVGEGKVEDGQSKEAIAEFKDKVIFGEGGPGAKIYGVTTYQDPLEVVGLAQRALEVKRYHVMTLVHLIRPRIKWAEEEDLGDMTRLGSVSQEIINPCSKLRPAEAAPGP